MRVLVTGGAGFIGSHVCDLLLARGDEVFVFDSLDPQVHPSGEWPAYQPDHHLLTKAKVDIRLPKILRAAVWDFRPYDVVIHLAAKVGVGQSAIEPGAYMEVNGAGTGNLLQALGNVGKPARLVVASSMSAYGEGLYTSKSSQVRPGLRDELAMSLGEWEHQTDEPIWPVGIPEAAELDPTSIYAESKATTERCALIWGEQHGVPTAAVRLFNVYGQRQALSNPYTGVAAIFASALLRGEEPVIYEDGFQSRDFVHVEDVARAIVLLADNDYHGPVNVGTGQATSILALAQGLRDRLGGPEPKVTGRFRAGDIRHCIADATLLRSLGWEPEVPMMPAGLDALAAWARSLPAEATDVRDLNPHAELDQHGLLLGDSDAS